MSHNATTPISPVPAVSPVVDYEPAAFGGPPILPPVTSLRRRTHVPAPAVVRPVGPDTHAAAVFADAALRRVLEVIDRRRPLAQLRPLLAAGLVESLLPGATGRGTGEPARLRRVRAQATRPDGCAVEVAAHYTRGNRTHAIACRVEQHRTATGHRWQVVALHLG